jgi:hypothetical protein
MKVIELSNHSRKKNSTSFKKAFPCSGSAEKVKNLK